MNPTTGVILIHGAGLGRFIWREVMPLIPYPTVAIDFPHRETGDQANRYLSWDDYLTDILQQINAWDQGYDELVVVAHSIGGGIALALHHHLGERMRGLMGIGAAFPASGRSFISCLPVPQRQIMPLLLRIVGTKPPASSLGNELGHDLPDELRDEVIRRFTPESRQLYTAPVHYSSLPPSRQYLTLTDDRAFSTRVQERMIAQLAPHTTASLPSGHLPMMSHPKAVAEIISTFVGQS